jgi:hypothetical protein
LFWRLVSGSIPIEILFPLARERQEILKMHLNFGLFCYSPELARSIAPKEILDLLGGGHGMIFLFWLSHGS